MDTRTNTSLRSRGAQSLVIVGAGHCGLAVAQEAKRRGLAPVILDAASRGAASWRGRHEQLRLNTHRRLSHLPGMRIPRRLGAFPRRDDLVAYLEEYERRLDVPVHRETPVRRIDPAPGGWRLETPRGAWRARDVVVATGHERVPVIPDWPGRDGFRGELVHSARFGHADRFRGRHVLVVGAGNSGTDVLNHLVRVETASLRVSVRHGPTVLPTRVLGIPLQLLSPLMSPLPAWLTDALMAATERLTLGNLRKLGLPRHRDGVATRLIREGVAPAFDDGFVAALGEGRVEVVARIERFEGETIVLRGGRRERPDVVIAATGYRPGLEPLVGHLGVLDTTGRPLRCGPETVPGSEGLWFAGMDFGLSGVFHAARGEARRLGKAIARRRRASAVTAGRSRSPRRRAGVGAPASA